MRGSFGLLRNSNGVVRGKVIGDAAKLVSCSAFSTTSSGGGRGRGRGWGSFGGATYDFVGGSSQSGEIESNEGVNDLNQSFSGMGRGHGRGKPLPSSPALPSFNSFVASDQPSPQQQGSSRGRGGVISQPSELGNEGKSTQLQGLSRGRGGVISQPSELGNEGKSTQLQGLSRGRGGVISQPSQLGNVGEPTQQQGLSRGRGRVISQPSELGNEGESPQQQGLGGSQGGVISPPSELGNEWESRPKGPVIFRKDEESDDSKPSQPIGEKKLPQNMLDVLPGSGRGMPIRKFVSDEKPKEHNRHLRAQGDGSLAGRGKGRLELKEGMPKLSREEALKRAMGILAKQDDNSGGRGRGRGTGTGRGRGRNSDKDNEESEDKDIEFMGDDVDGEELAQKLGPARMAELTKTFKDLSTDVFPDPVMDKYIDALDTNLQIELEPEYLFGDFETNPDINETPPISLEDTLEKMKPFLMAYEGIGNQKEWEVVMKETMEKVPLMKEIVDHYCGPDRVSAKQQQAELERVAKALPASAPDSVVRFTNRAVRSLQSNPGWGFDKKYQLMDKMVAEFSKTYK